MINEGGWKWAISENDDGSTDVHVYPADDLRDHRFDKTKCWCEPYWQRDGDGEAIMHRARDNRPGAMQ
jgi:hypothetical protein